MLTTRECGGYWMLLLALLLGGCSATPVLHEFPQGMAASARPDAAVSYTLREKEKDDERWILRGEQGDALGEFRFKRGFRAVEGAATDRAEDFRRDDLFQDGINGRDYIFRLAATSGSLKRSTLSGAAAPRVTIYTAATGQRVGELALRSGFDLRFEGDWQGRPILWRGELVPDMQVERESDDGAVLDTYPAAQLLQWTGGSNAGLVFYAGREVAGDPPAFAASIFDLQAGRPLTRSELGDSIVLMFAIRAVQEAAVLVNAVKE